MFQDEKVSERGGGTQYVIPAMDRRALDGQSKDEGGRECMLPLSKDIKEAIPNMCPSSSDYPTF